MQYFRDKKCPGLRCWCQPVPYSLPPTYLINLMLGPLLDFLELSKALHFDEEPKYQMISDSMFKKLLSTSNPSTTFENVRWIVLSMSEMPYKCFIMPCYFHGFMLSNKTSMKRTWSLIIVGNLPVPDFSPPPKVIPDWAKKPGFTSTFANILKRFKLKRSHFNCIRKRGGLTRPLGRRFICQRSAYMEVWLDYTELTCFS